MTTTTTALLTEARKLDAEACECISDPSDRCTTPTAARVLRQLADALEDTDANLLRVADERDAFQDAFAAAKARLATMEDTEVYRESQRGVWLLNDERGIYGCAFC